MTPARRTGGRVPPLARVSRLGDLAALVPYLIGFVPHESLVCLALDVPGRPPGRVGLTARVDLAGVLHPLGGGELVDSVLDSIARTGARRVIAFVVSEADAVDGLVFERLFDAADRSALEVREVGWLRGDRCFSVLCDDPVCCPPEGFEVDPACIPAVAAAYAGTAVLPDRAAVEAELAPTGGDASLDPLIEAHEVALLRAQLSSDPGGGPSGDAATAVDTEAAEAVLELARVHDLHRDDPRALPPLDDDVVAACLAALAHVTVRDLVWLAVDAQEVDGGGLWLELARRAPSPYDASPLFLLGWRSWRRGDGVRAVLAAERADATPGGYSAARLLLDAVSAGLDPATVPPLSMTA